MRGCSVNVGQSCLNDVNKELYCVSLLLRCSMRSCESLRVDRCLRMWDWSVMICLRL